LQPGPPLTRTDPAPVLGEGQRCRSAPAFDHHDDHDDDERETGIVAAVVRVLMIIIIVVIRCPSPRFITEFPRLMRRFGLDLQAPSSCRLTMQVYRIFILLSPAKHFSASLNWPLV
jgi:hypothetical protein